MIQDVPQQREISIEIYGDFKITMMPMKKLFLGFILENPKLSGYLEVGRTKLPVYNNYMLYLAKGLYVPVWMNFFVGSSSNYDRELEKELYGMYQRWFNDVRRNSKYNPKIKLIKLMRDDSNDTLTFNIAFWSAVFLKVKKEIVEKTIGKAWPQLWKTVGKDYGYFVKLSGYAVYPLRHYINMMMSQLEKSDTLIYNILTLTKRQYPPLIKIPGYPVEPPYLPPLHLKESTGRDYDSFELQTNLFENLTIDRINNNVKHYNIVKKELLRNTYYHTTFCRLKSFNILSTINPYHTKKMLIWDNGAYKLIDYVQIKKYGKPESFYTFKKNYLNDILNTYFKTGELSYDKNGFTTIIKSKNGYKYIGLVGTIIDVWSNGGVVFELGVNKYDEYAKRKTIVIPSELLTTIRMLTTIGKGTMFSTETYPAIQVGKLKILIEDDYTHPLSYSMLGTWGRALKKNKN